MDPEAFRAKIQARAPRTEARSWYEISNATADDVATIRLYDEISWFGIDAESFARELDAISAPKIEVQINSPGGNVFDGIAIYNALRAHPAHVTTRVDSMAGSIASVIAQAGDHRVMLTGSQMMIHEAWGAAIGNAADMREMADILDHQSNILAGIYAERSGGDVAAFRQTMIDEAWLTADAAVELGLADEVVKPDRQGEARTIDELRAVLGLDALAAKVDELVAKIPAAPAAGSPGSDPEPEPSDSDPESFLRAVLAHTRSENE